MKAIKDYNKKKAKNGQIGIETRIKSLYRFFIAGHTIQFNICNDNSLLIKSYLDIVADNEDINPHLKHYDDIKHISYIERQTHHTYQLSFVHTNTF